MVDEFVATKIEGDEEEETEDKAGQEPDLDCFGLMSEIAGNDIIQLKSNIIPRGLVILE